MPLVAIDGMPLVSIGHAGRDNTTVVGTVSTITQDAVNEACHMIGQIFTEDGNSHTIDTTGSSSLGWRSGALTWANAGSTFVVGLATVDTATGPPGRATNSSDVITFSVSKSHTGGGGTITANAWQENVPDTGTMTIANGDLVAFCTQMTARGGTDSVVTQCASAASSPVMPSVTTFLSAVYTAQNAYPNAVITFSDGKLGFFYGGQVALTFSTTQTWNNGSATKEYGNFLQLPVPAKIYGILANCDVAGNTDFVLYSDPLGTPVAEKTYSIDLNTVGASGNGRWLIGLFAAPYTSTANQPLAAIMKPTSATNISSPYVRFNASNHQKSLNLGTNGYAVSRASGAFAAVNSNKDRFSIGLLIGALDDGSGGGGPVGQQCT